MNASIPPPLDAVQLASYLPAISHNVLASAETLYARCDIDSADQLAMQLEGFRLHVLRIRHAIAQQSERLPEP